MRSESAISDVILVPGNSSLVRLHLLLLSVFTFSFTAFSPLHPRHQRPAFTSSVLAVKGLTMNVAYAPPLTAALR